MPKKFNFDNFIEQIKKIHNNFYDYSSVNFKNIRTKIKIICPIHGEFEQKIYSHINGSGCSKCGKIKCSLNRKNKGTIWFIKKVNLIFDNKYDYSKTDYNGPKRKIIIICPIHGEFKKDLWSHINGSGCSKCSGMYRRTTNEFIEESNKIHNNFYDYSLAEFKSVYSKIEIICPIHGKFKQLPSNHLQGRGCKICNESKGEKEISKFLIENNINFNREKTFDECKSEKGYKLRFDFWIPNYNICIEFDGKQHFEQIKHFSKESFQITIKNDKIKNEFCLKNNINLLRIKYDQLENIKNILNKQLNIK